MAERMTDERLAEIERAVFDLEGWPVNCSKELLQALKAEREEVDRLRKIHGEYDLEALLQTYILLHKDKVTAHWLWVAIERIGGGEVVAECLEDYGYVPLARAEAAERKLTRLVDWLETLDGHPLPNHIETILKEARNG